MDVDQLDKEWAVILSLLPRDWRRMAREHGAMQRSRGGIASAEVLLKLMLMHVAGGLSLRQTSVRARETGLANVSDVALFKRLRGCGKWFEAMCAAMLRGKAVAEPASLAPWRLRAVDATTVKEPGDRGASYRVHYAFSLREFRCDHITLTETKGKACAEDLSRFAATSGDLLLADRGYSRRNGVASLLGTGADVVVRLHSTSFPLLDAVNGAPVDLLARLRSLDGQAPGEWRVRFEYEGKSFDGRLCAVRKDARTAAIARRKAASKAKRCQRKASARTIESAEYVFVFTTLPGDRVDTASVLQAYRARWCIEIQFKRLKSLLRFGHLPKTGKSSAEPWIHGKLLYSLLVERLLQKARSFSPWGFGELPKGPMGLVRGGS